MHPISPSHLLGTQAALFGLQLVTEAQAPVLRPIPQQRVSTQLLLCYKQGLQPGSITQGSGTDCEGGTQDHSLKASTASDMFHKGLARDMFQAAFPQAVLDSVNIIKQP